MNDKYPFVNIPLPYEYDALEPYVDQKTMELHHGRHLKTYIDNLNSVLEKNPRFQKFTLKELIIYCHRFPIKIRKNIKNNAGGVYNHRFFFNVIGPRHEDYIKNIVLAEIDRQFGNFEKFRSEFKSAALSVFGSGYAWLVYENGKMKIVATVNQDTPDLKNQTPILNIDVWEHAYYLKHYNVRAAYIDNWFETIDWVRVDRIFCRIAGYCLGR